MDLKNIDKQRLIAHINNSDLSEQHKKEAIAFVEASNNWKDLIKGFLRTLRTVDTIKDFFDLVSDDG